MKDKLLGTFLPLLLAGSFLITSLGFGIITTLISKQFVFLEFLFGLFSLSFGVFFVVLTSKTVWDILKDRIW